MLHSTSKKKSSMLHIKFTILQKWSIKLNKILLSQFKTISFRKNVRCCTSENFNHISKSFHWIFKSSLNFISNPPFMRLCPSSYGICLSTTFQSNASHLRINSLCLIQNKFIIQITVCLFRKRQLLLTKGSSNMTK